MGRVFLVGAGPAAADSVAVSTGAGDAIAVARALIGQGRSPSTPAALIENASRADRVVSTERIASLPTLAPARGNGPARIVIGEVVRDVAARPATEARPRVAAVR